VLVSLLAVMGVFHQPLWILIVIAFLPMLAIALDLPHGLFARFGLTATAPAPASASTAPGVAPSSVASNSG
jgi:hypothetical protein